MFIVVNCFTKGGLDECGRFEIHDEAFKWIAENVKNCYDFDLMSVYPFDDNSSPLVYSDSTVSVLAGDNWCTCYHRDYNYRNDYTDYYLIIEA